MYLNNKTNTYFHFTTLTVKILKTMCNINGNFSITPEPLFVNCYHDNKREVWEEYKFSIAV